MPESTEDRPSKRGQARSDQSDYLARGRVSRPPGLGARVNRFGAFRSMRIRGPRRSPPKTFRIGRIVGKLNAVEGDYLPMAEETRDRLQQWFDADNAALARWLGRDLSG